MPILGKRLFLERKARSGRKTAGRKSNTYKVKPHAKEESMQGMHARRPNHARVRVLVRYCNG
jgi:hypothetical protein